MLHFKRIGSETKVINHDLAAQFSTMTASVTERELNKKRMDYLKAVVLSGSALPFIWARAKVTETGEVYRVNGHHSSTMLTTLNGQLPDNLVAHIDDFEVPTVKDLPVLFQQFDSRKSTRSLADISGAYQMVVPELRNAGRLEARKAIEGAAWYEKNVVGKDVPKDEGVFTLFQQPTYHDFVHLVDKLYSAKTPEFTKPVIGCMFGSWDHAPTAAEEFWADVSKQGGSHSGDEKHPAVVLDAWLLFVKGADRKPKDLEIYRACAVAWNAFRNGRSLDKISKYDPKKGAPDLE